MTEFALPATTLHAAGLRPEQIARLEAMIGAHIAEGRYPGAQIAIARHGKLAVFNSYGEAASGRAADARSLWLLYSNTKVVTAAACWVLAERGAFRFTDRVSDHIPGFAQNGKGEVTILQVITHRAGYPNAQVPAEAWEDHDKLRESVCNFSLEFTPGSRLHYHGQSAHWTLAALIESLTGQDYRQFIREAVIAPLGLAGDIFVGLPDAEFPRAADMHSPRRPDQAEAGSTPLAEANTAAWRRAGAPGAGGYATARGMAALYQMMLGGGELAGQRILGPRTLAYAIRNWPDDMVDSYMGMPMHRGLGPHLRGTTPTVRGLGSFASPGTFGHGGVGSSYCWADPDSGVSFAYLTNCRIPDPWHSQRLDVISNFVHSAII